jgi:hypothetical protein
MCQVLGDSTEDLDDFLLTAVFHSHSVRVHCSSEPPSSSIMDPKVPPSTDRIGELVVKSGPERLGGVVGIFL